MNVPFLIITQGFQVTYPLTKLLNPINEINQGTPIGQHLLDEGTNGCYEGRGDENGPI